MKRLELYDALYSICTEDIHDLYSEKILEKYRYIFSKMSTEKDNDFIVGYNKVIDFLHKALCFFIDKYDESIFLLKDDAKIYIDDFSGPLNRIYVSCGNGEKYYIGGISLLSHFGNFIDYFPSMIDLSYNDLIVVNKHKNSNYDGLVKSVMRSSFSLTIQKLEGSIGNLKCKDESLIDQYKTLREESRLANDKWPPLFFVARNFKEDILSEFVQAMDSELDGMGRREISIYVSSIRTDHRFYGMYDLYSNIDNLDAIISDSWRHYVDNLNSMGNLFYLTPYQFLRFDSNSSQVAENISRYKITKAFTLSPSFGYSHIGNSIDILFQLFYNNFIDQSVTLKKFSDTHGLKIRDLLIKVE